MLLVACRRRRSTTLLGGAEIGRTPALGRPRGSKCCARRPGYQSPSVASPPHRLAQRSCRRRIGLSLKGSSAPPLRMAALCWWPAPRASCPCQRPRRISTTRRDSARLAVCRETLGDPWFILSAEHGLVAPDEWLAPYERYLPDTPREYRRAWGEWVVVRLDLLLGGLAGTVVELHAGESYVQPILGALERRGAVIERPLQGLTSGRWQGWYDAQAADGRPRGRAPPFSLRWKSDTGDSHARRCGPGRTPRAS